MNWPTTWLRAHLKAIGLPCEDHHTGVSAARHTATRQATFESVRAYLAPDRITSATVFEAKERGPNRPERVRPRRRSALRRPHHRLHRRLDGSWDCTCGGAGKFITADGKSGEWLM